MPAQVQPSYPHILCCACLVVSPQISAAHNRYEVGLKKLDFTAAQVELMRQELRALKPVLERTVRCQGPGQGAGREVLVRHCC